MQLRVLFFLGLFLVGLPYYPILLDGQSALLYRDLSNVILPFKTLWAEAVIELARIPHWNPMHSGGANFVNDPSVGPLYPLNIIFCFFSASKALVIFLYLHLVLIFAGFFLYFSRLHYRPALVLLGSLAIAWSGVSLSAHNLPHVLGAQASVGFFLFFLLRGKGILNLFLCSLAMAWPIYAGDPQYSYFMALIALVTIVRSSQDRIGRFFLFPLALLAGAPQIFPTVALLLSRVVAIPQSEMIPWSLHPARVFELLFPLPFGASPDPVNYWANFLITPGAGAPFLFSLYIGTTCVFFFFYHLFLKSPRRLTKWNDLFALGLVIFFLPLALGSNFPISVYAFFEKWVPFWKSFRYPERLSYWVVLGIILFSVRGMEKILRLRANKKHLIAPGLVFCFLALGFFIWLQSRDASTFPVGYALVPFFLLLLIMGIDRWKEYRASLILVVMIFELLPIGHRLLFKQPKELTEAKSFSWAEKILAHRKGISTLEADRFYTLVREEFAPSIPLKERNVEAFTYTTWASMKYYTPITWGIPVIIGHSSLAPVVPAQTLLAAGAKELSKALNIYSARYLLNISGDQLQASVNQDALPLAFAPIRVENVSNNLMAKLLDPLWKEREVALIEAEVDQTLDALEVKGFRKKWDELSIAFERKESQGDAWMVVNESYDPQWKAMWKELVLPIARANGWAMAVKLPMEATGGEIRLEYRDKWFSWGKVALGFWFLLFVALMGRERNLFKGGLLGPLRR